MAPKLSIILTPHGRLNLQQDEEAQSPIEERFLNAFKRGSGHGLLLLGVEESGTALPPVASYWRDFGAHYVTALCSQPSQESLIATIRDEELDRIALAAPPMTGGEYLTAEVLRSLWRELDT